MKTFSLRLGLALLSIVALQGCHFNPRTGGAGSIQEFARDLNGKKYPLKAAKLVTAQQIPEGLMFALEPAQALCTSDGGQPSFSHLREAEGTRGKLPQRMVCHRDTGPLWVLFITYADVVMYSSAVGPLAMITFLASVSTAEQYAVQVQEEKATEQAQAEAREKAAAAQLERQAASERERPRRIARAQQAERERSARLAAFQANLKAGDRFRWNRRKTLDIEGMVVRVEGAVVLVQLDRPTLSGQQTLYIPKHDIEPIN